MRSILPNSDSFFQKVILSSKYYFFSQNVDHSPKYRSVLKVTDLFFWIRGLLSHVSNMSFQFNSKIQTTISMLLSRAVFFYVFMGNFFLNVVSTLKSYILQRWNNFFFKLWSILFWVKIGYLWNFKFHCNISDSLKTLCNYSERTTLCSE